MSAVDQMFSQKLTVRQRTVYVSTGSYLKDIQVAEADAERG